MDSLPYEPPGNPGEVEVQIIEIKSSFIIGLSMYSMFDIKISLYIRQKSFFKSDLISYFFPYTVIVNRYFPPK